MENFSVELTYINKVCKGRFEFPEANEATLLGINSINRFAILDLGFPQFIDDNPQFIVKDNNSVVVAGDSRSVHKAICIDDNIIYWRYDGLNLAVNSNMILYFYATCVFKQVSAKPSRLNREADSITSSIELLNGFLSHVKEVECAHSGIHELPYWERIVEDLLGYIE